MHEDRTVAETECGLEELLLEILNELYFELSEALVAAGGADRRGG